MNDIKVVTFPTTMSEALALEYAKSKLLSSPEMTPEEFYEVYKDAYVRIKQAKQPRQDSES